MKIPVLFTVTLLSVLSMAAMFRPTTATPSATTAPRDGMEFKGSIDAWVVEEDGSIVLRMHCDDDVMRWLRTPPSQSATTQFELLALHAILRLEQTPDQPVHVRGEATTERDGSRRDQAMRLLSIGRL